MGNAVAVTGQTFDSEVLKSNLPVLVDFWAAWCGPCRAIAPAIEEIAGEYAGQLKVVKIDTDENQDIAVQFQVMSIPTLMVFKGGKVVERVIGAMPKAVLMNKIKPHLAA
ncbi:MAG: thioredoxin [Candidatus Eiseniibacteriota bacterium]